MAIALLTLAIVFDGRESNQRQLRAYVRISIDSVALDPAQWIAGERPTVQLFAENTGQSPARECVAEVIMTMMDFPITQPFRNEAADINTSRFVAHPRERHRFGVRLDRAFSAEDLRNITLNGDRRLFINARVEYLDIFGKSRWTTFRAMSNRVGGGVTLMHAPEGNDFE